MFALNLNLDLNKLKKNIVYYRHTKNIAYWFCWNCRKEVMPIWELTAKGIKADLTVQEAKKEKGEKRQIPSSLYWISLSPGQISYALCGAKCSLEYHEKENETNN